MQMITINFEGRQYEMELYTSVVGEKNVYTVLVSDPELIIITGRVISYLSDINGSLKNSVIFSSDKEPFKGRLKATIASAIKEEVKK